MEATKNAPGYLGREIFPPREGGSKPDNRNHGILKRVKNKAKEKFDAFGDGWGFACGCAF